MGSQLSLMSDCTTVKTHSKRVCARKPVLSFKLSTHTRSVTGSCVVCRTEMLAIMKSIWTVAIPAYLRRIVYAALHTHMKTVAQPVRAGRYTGSYRIPVFFFLTIWIFKIPQYRCHLNNVRNVTLLERGLFSLLHFGKDTAVCVTKRERSETEAQVECDEREVIHNIHIDRHKYPPSAASAPASLTI